MASGSPAVLVDNISFSYDGRPALKNVSLTISRKEFAWVVGPNGGGKTTLLKLLLGLLRPQAGSIRVFGHPPRLARRRIGYMPQQAQLDAQFPVTVMDIALMGRLGHRVRLGPYAAADRAVARRALEEVGLEDQARRSLSQLSGGQQRRLLIARALAAEPDLLVLDEPTANLDRLVEREFYELLRRLNDRLTIIMVSHDPAFVSGFVKQVVCVNQTVTVHPTSVREGAYVGEVYGSGIRVVRHDQRRDERS